MLFSIVTVYRDFCSMGTHLRLAKMNNATTRSFHVKNEFSEKRQTSNWILISGSIGKQRTFNGVLMILILFEQFALA